MNAEEVFLSAVEMSDRQRRQDFVEGIFGEFPELRGPVEALLRSHESAGSFLAEPLVDLQPTISEIHEPAHKSGDYIGPYLLNQVIADGGMGVVYAAQQKKPVQRRVALKIIKPGTSSKSIIARFEAERQTLALMDHPNIARVIDAGSTDSGQPYFVMELINGIPITEYCDRARMTARQRLGLMIPICAAVQHAHQKGIIHRDLKPSNVLVTEYDARPVPKIIDFGVAKALGSRFSEDTMHTQFGQVIGTLEYMSPEQAGLNQLDIDTRSDVYALGVLIYDLLTGSTPLERQKIRGAAILDILKMIREVEPQRPSDRISSSEETPRIAANRSTDATRLHGLFRGELDWIVMKALDKDRNRRYQSAANLADDIQRFLRDEPVQARPASMVYRLRKLIRRKRAGLLLAGSLLVLAAVTLIGGWSFRLASMDAQRERMQLAHERLVNKAHGQIPAVEHAIRGRKFEDALSLLQEIEQLIPDHPSLPALSDLCSQRINVSSNPAGAEIWRRAYADPSSSWKKVVDTVTEPVTLRVPRGEFLWRASKSGYRDAFGLRPWSAVSFALESSHSSIADMLCIPAGRPNRPGMAFANAFNAVDLPAFLIDRCEVTNSEFEKFVNSGGYERREFWQDLPFVAEDGTELTWEQAKRLFVDQTGHFGPANWRDGQYLEGEGDHPVQGVSWYEATAYARFAGKSLPTIYHWTLASQVEFSVVLAGDAFITQSNYGKQLVPVNSLSDFNFHGLLGVMGNVREWCTNANDEGKRFVLGGACDDPIYVPLTLHAAHPLQRDPFFGFRCVSYLNGEDGPREADETCHSIPWPKPPTATELFDERSFQMVVKDRIHYNPNEPLESTVDEMDEGHWIHLIAKINTAYRDASGRWERMDVHLYLPKIEKPKNGFQTVVYSPARDGWMLPRMRPLEKEYELDRLVRSGRAVVRPMFYGNYERRQNALPTSIRDWEEWRTRLGLDLMRTVDYLEQRGDIDMDQLCYFGFSWGAEWAGSLVSIEPRFKAAVFEAGGLNNSSLRQDALFLEWRHCLPHIHIPVLMINGQNDTIYPVAESQRPMFELLGSSNKEHYVHPNGHHMLPPEIKFQKMIAWLDQIFFHQSSAR